MLLSKTDERSIMDGNGNLQGSVADAAGPEDEVAAVEVRRGLIAMVRGGDVDLEQSASLATTARGGAQLNQSASVALISGGDTSLHLSAAVAAPSLGDLHLDKSACAAVVAPAVRVERSAVGVALARRVEVGEGGRVLLRPLAAAALGIGLGIGFGLALTAGAGWFGLRAWRSRFGADGDE